jgi:ABC-2 type transport system permease protein
MNALLSPLLGGFQAEIMQLLRSRLFVALTIIQAVTFLFLVSLFGLTGSNAPTAIVSEDQGAYARLFVATLAATHHSFALRTMDQASAEAALQRGELVAIITIPKNFSSAIAQGEDTGIKVTVDNVNTDMTEDIQRALPSAIVAFGRQLQLPGIRVHVAEHDLIDHDTGFIPYLVVSALALDAFVIASILSAMTVAREFESGTIKLLSVAPAHPLLSILGRVLATDVIAAVAMVLPVALVVFGYHILPLYPLTMVGVTLLCIAVFSCIGVALGAVLKRTLPVASLVLGLSLPLYLASGSLEPERFDGNGIWLLAHLSPVYYAVGILEQAFHGLQVTPESVSTDFMTLLGWAAVMLLLAGIFLQTTLREKTTARRVKEERKSGHWQRRLMSSGKWLWQKRFVALDRNVLSWLLVILFLIGGEVWFQVQRSLLVETVNDQQNAALLAATEQQQEMLLLHYMDRISDLFVNNNLLSAKPTDATAIVANALTQETLLQLDPEHKAALLRFLYSTRLIDDEFHVISLEGADLHGADLANLDLSDINLSGVNFSSADLQGADLSFGALTSANLSNANLTGANLSGVDMHNANLNNANLTGANLQGVIGLGTDQLAKARSLAGTILPDGSVLPGKDTDTDDGL